MGVPALIGLGPLLMLWQGNPLMLWWPLVFLYVAVPLADALLGEERSNPPESAVAVELAGKVFVIGVVAGVVGWVGVTGVVGVVGVVGVFGVVGGVVGIEGSFGVIVPVVSLGVVVVPTGTQECVVRSKR